MIFLNHKQRKLLSNAYSDISAKFKKEDLLLLGWTISQKLLKKCKDCFCIVFKEFNSLVYMFMC